MNSDREKPPPALDIETILRDHERRLRSEAERSPLFEEVAKAEADLPSTRVSEVDPPTLALGEPVGSVLWFDAEKKRWIYRSADWLP